MSVWDSLSLPLFMNEMYTGREICPWRNSIFLPRNGHISTMGMWVCLVCLWVLFLEFSQATAVAPLCRHLPLLWTWWASWPARGRLNVFALPSASGNSEHMPFLGASPCQSKGNHSCLFLGANLWWGKGSLIICSSLSLSRPVCLGLKNKTPLASLPPSNTNHSPFSKYGLEGKKSRYWVFCHVVHFFFLEPRLVCFLKRAKKKCHVFAPECAREN